MYNPNREDAELNYCESDEYGNNRRVVKRPSDLQFKENNRRDEGEDMLLNQIDEFRAKAQKIQFLIRSKEKKVKDLETLLREKEIKNIELQNILSKRHREADSVMGDLNDKFDKLIDAVNLHMLDIKKNISNDISGEDKNSLKQNILSKRHREADSVMGDLNDKFDKLIDAVNLHMLDIKKNISNDISGEDKNSLKQTKAIQYTLSSMNDEINGLKKDISDKVHTENVKLYRNIEDSLKSNDYSDRVLANYRMIRTLKKSMSVIILLSVFNFFGIAILILLRFGLI